MFRCPSCGAFNRIPAERLTQVRAGQSPGEAVCGRCKAALDLSGAPQDVDSAGLARAVESSPLPVLVDFWAPWCGPCKVAGPVLDQLARGRAGNLLALKVNTDEEQVAASKLGVQGIPTFVLFKEGREIARQSGAMSRTQLAQFLARHGAGA